jgi:hypothetical protein
MFRRDITPSKRKRTGRRKKFRKERLSLRLRSQRKNPNSFTSLS